MAAIYHDKCKNVRDKAFFKFLFSKTESIIENFHWRIFNHLLEKDFHFRLNRRYNCPERISNRIAFDRVWVKVRNWDGEARRRIFSLD